jgi:hypothetical protein
VHWLSFLLTPTDAHWLSFLLTPTDAHQSSYLLTPTDVHWLSFLLTPTDVHWLSFLLTPTDVHWLSFLLTPIDFNIYCLCICLLGLLTIRISFSPTDAKIHAIPKFRSLIQNPNLVVGLTWPGSELPVVMNANIDPATLHKRWVVMFPFNIDVCDCTMFGMFISICFLVSMIY